jgi:hypothetical protein
MVRMFRSNILPPFSGYRPQIDVVVVPFKESYRLCKKDYETEEEARAQQRAAEPWMNA